MISVSRRVETLQHIINRLLTQQQNATQAERQALHVKRNHVITQRNALIHSVDPEAIL